MSKKTSVVVTDDTRFSRMQVTTIKDTVAVGATDSELQLFLFHCERTGLDPLSRQIHFIKRGGKATIQTGIDGFRAIAERTGVYAGNDDYVFNNGRTMYHMVDAKELPKTATATVYKIVGGQRVAFSATAVWDAYCPEKGNFMWMKMPYLMLGKCAEALALRKAFPNDLSGLYTTDEMAQAGPADDIKKGKAMSGVHTTKAKTSDKVKKLKERVEVAQQNDKKPSTEGVMTDAQTKKIKKLVDAEANTKVKSDVINWLDDNNWNCTKEAADECIKKLKANIDAAITEK